MISRTNPKPAWLPRPVIFLALVSFLNDIVLLRSLDRVGKGIRSAPRDAMIGELTPPDRTGLAFGFHRALDNFGAVLGGLTAAVVVYLVTADLATVLLLSAIP